MRDSTLRVSALLSVRRDMVGCDAGVRLGARVGAGTEVDEAEEIIVTSAPPPSPSPLEEDSGVCSKNVPSSRERRGETGELRCIFR